MGGQLRWANASTGTLWADSSLSPLAGEYARLQSNSPADIHVNRPGVVCSLFVVVWCKLSIFTVLGMTEPRVVKLFPRETCSCPATAACYHIVAARRAVGIAGTDRRRGVNLTRLRWNKQKRADKTGGRKRPRTADIDVVADPDADAGVGAALLGSPGPAPSPAPPASPAVDAEICHSCDAIELPPRKNAKRRGSVNWVKCDSCPRWYHTVCVRVRNTTAPYHCDMCR